MNKQAVKRLKLIFNPKEGGEASRRAYRLAKKKYTRLPSSEKANFIKHLELIHNQ
tara:strand:- start:3503 stop:3667 length:165 start_codon:yes stop_codon:yes gene_type:complete